ncbi:hypothetical protein GCM10023160_33490 [Brachybacterium paraconglomeratum]
MVEDLELALISSPKNETRATLETVADAQNPLEGFSAEYTYVTR